MNTIIAKFPSIDYVLIKRQSDFLPWIAAWHYCEEDGTWGQGHYFSNKYEAVNYIAEIIKERRTEMRSWKNVEIVKGPGAENFRNFLKENGYRYEPSGCFNYIHFEIYCNKEEEMKINDFLYNLAVN